MARYIDDIENNNEVYHLIMDKRIFYTNFMVNYWRLNQGKLPIYLQQYIPYSITHP